MQVVSETASSADEEETVVVVSVAGGNDRRSKHRILAELKLLDQDSEFLQEELEELEKTDNVSTIWMDLLQNMESRPDPLLPEIHGPVNFSWDRWFEGSDDPQACRCYIL